MKNNFKIIQLLLSMILFLFASFALFLLYREINLNNQKATMSTTELENETSRRNEVKLLNDSIEVIKEDKSLLETHFAQSSDVVPFLDTIEALGPMVGVKAQTTSVDILKDNTGLVVKISASGDFKNIYKFLTLLENSPYELEITSMDLQKEASTIVPVDPTAPQDSKPVIALPQESKWQAVFGIKLLSFVQ
ncbi:MAG: hypothetical protein KGL67_00780 [Patescibacteria group bacterium]|nr:hypothetical protein [Patescibacteria group bacterium]